MTDSRVALNGRIRPLFFLPGYFFGLLIFHAKFGEEIFGSLRMAPRKFGVSYKIKTSFAFAGRGASERHQANTAARAAFDRVIIGTTAAGLSIGEPADIATPETAAPAR